MMKTKHLAAGALAVVALAGCRTVPAEYAAGLSQQDPKWRSAQCQSMRTEAARYEENDRSAFPASGFLLGPYGAGLALASAEHREEQRKAFARELHQKCSSLPMPDSLKAKPPRPS